ncbi:MAG TPA: MlaD family protein, partial [Solirubrobacterales bacterium]|nr:MlaD family protein [Solirubrobacterales bacterium]
MSRLPERDTRQGATNRRFKWRPSNALVAVIFILIFTVGPYLAFTGHVPFTSYGYELKATFSNSANIALNSPVRIAGVEVGRVTSTSRDGDNTDVTFTVEGAGRPIHSDAFAEIRPRIFLEGNFFIELDPGSPSAPEMPSDATIPVSHTSTAVQLDEVLTALQSPVRADLSRLLESYGEALTHKPTAAEDVTQLPEVQGKTGAEGLNGAFKYGGPSS